MNGKRAKMLRRIAYGDHDPRDVEYKMVVCPNQYRHKSPNTIIADEKRFMYQTLKGRRGLPAI